MRILLGTLIFVSFLSAQISTKFEHVKELLNKRNSAQAEKILINILNEDENQPDVYYYLGVASLINQDYESAIDRLGKAIDLNDNDYRYYEQLGDAFGLKAQKTNIFSAIFVIKHMRTNWEKAVELNPEIVSARERLFSYYAEAPGIAGGDLEKALMYANQVLSLEPAKGHLLFSRYYTKIENDQEAEKELLAAVRLDSLNSDLLNRLGYHYLGRESPQKAMAVFNKAVGLSPDNPNSYDSKGDCFMHIEQHDSALAMFEKALEKNPEFEPSLYNRAHTLHLLNRIEQAKEAGRHYLRKYPDGRFASKAKKIVGD